MIRLGMHAIDKIGPEQGKISAESPGISAGPSRVGLEAAVVKREVTEEGEFVLDVGFCAAPGFTILFGPSGSGKTTLLDCVAGLRTPDSGSIKAGERLLFDSKERVNLSPAKRRVGYVFQDLALFPHLTIKKNVEFGLGSFRRSERKARAQSMLESFRIATLAERYPKQVSGGERQRAALARTLVTDPAVLLLDEPLAALDVATKSRIIDDLRAWNAAHRIPILYVTHNREEVFGLGEQVIVLDQGRILVQGTPHEVLDAPQRETVAQLAGFENIFDAIVEGVHADRGTMSCSISHQASKAKRSLLLETPLVRARAGETLRIAIRAGDILLAAERPVGLSARNVIAGRMVSLETRGVIVSARIDCGVEMEVHMTLAARDFLQLAPGQPVWLVIKTHSCHLMK